MAFTSLVNGSPQLNGDDYALTVPGTVGVGDVLVFIVSTYNDGLGTGITDNKGGNTWNLRNSVAVGSSGVTLGVYECVIVNGGTGFIATYTATAGQLQVLGMIAGATGMSASPDGGDTTSSGTGTTPAVTVTPTGGTNYEILAVLSTGDSAGTITADSSPWSELMNDDGGGDHVALFVQTRSATGAVTADPVLSVSQDWAMVGTASIVAGGGGTTGTGAITGTPAIAASGAYLLLEQEGFRFYNDDGSESGATAAGNQDTNVTFPLDTNLRLRLIVNATGDPPASGYQLEYRKVGETTWIPVST